MVANLSSRDNMLPLPSHSVRAAAPQALAVPLLCRQWPLWLGVHGDKPQIRNSDSAHSPVLQRINWDTAHRLTFPVQTAVVVRARRLP